MKTIGIWQRKELSLCMLRAFGIALTSGLTAMAAQAQQAIDKWYPHALDTFGSANSKFSELAIACGIRRWGNEELRQMWRKDIDPQIEKLGLRVPDAQTGRLIR